MLHLTEQERLAAIALARKNTAHAEGNTPLYVEADAELEELLGLPSDHEHRLLECGVCSKSFKFGEGEWLVLGVLAANLHRATGSELVFQTAPEYVRHFVIGPCCLPQIDVRGHLFKR